MTKKDIKLIKGIKAGNEKYLDKCIKQYTPYVAYIVGNIIGKALPQEDKEELVADVFVTIWTKRELLDEMKADKLKAYIGAIARNLSRNRLRDLNKRNLETELEDIFADEMDVEDALLNTEVQKKLIDCILTMGEVDQRCFLKFYYYQKPVKIIAAEEQMTESAVKSRLMRGREKLRVMLKEEEI